MSKDINTALANSKINFINYPSVIEGLNTNTATVQETKDLSSAVISSKFINIIDLSGFITKLLNLENQE